VSGRGSLPAVLGLLLGACAPPDDRYLVVHGDGGDAARAIFHVVFTEELAPPDNFVLRPDERGGVGVDPQRELLYVGSRTGTLLALRRDDGSVAWEKELGTAVGNVPVLAAEGSLLLLGTDDGDLLAVDPDTRATVWSHRTAGTIRAPPVVGDGVVYFTNSRNAVYAVDLRTGAWRWQYEREVPKDFTIHGRAGLSFQSTADGAGVDPGVLYTGFDDGRVVAIDASSGEALWVTNLAPPPGSGFADVDATPFIDPARGELVAAGQTTGIHALALEDGSVRWRLPIRGVGGVVRGPGASLLFASSIAGVGAVGPGGELFWRRQLDPGVLSAPLWVGGVAFVTHSAGGLIAFDARTGELLAQLETGSGMSGPPTVDAQLRRVYAVSNRGRLVALGLEDAI
jgi:outer membrane protein assembly factor BamB